MSDIKKALDAFYRSDEAQEFIRDDQFTCLASIAFNAGAAWQREQDERLAESHAKFFLKGSTPWCAATSIATYIRTQHDNQETSHD